MQKRAINKLTRIVIMMVASLAIMLSGCSAPQQPLQEQDAAQVTENRQYMSDLNQNVQELSGKLTAFVGAVGRGDVVTMQSEANNAFKVITAIESMQAPDDLKDLQSGYAEACVKLRDALNEYIGLYSEITSSVDGSAFDYSTYDERINSIQQKYNDAVAQLESTDNTATELKK